MNFSTSSLQQGTWSASPIKNCSRFYELIGPTVIASRGFRHSAVSVWNDLPAYIRNVSTISSFKHNLKTFLFTAAFANYSVVYARLRINLLSYTCARVTKFLIMSLIVIVIVIYETIFLASRRSRRRLIATSASIITTLSFIHFSFSSSYLTSLLKPRPSHAQPCSTK